MTELERYRATLEMIASAKSGIWGKIARAALYDPPEPPPGPRPAAAYRDLEHHDRLKDELAEYNLATGEQLTLAEYARMRDRRAAAGE